MQKNNSRFVLVKILKAVDSSRQPSNGVLTFLQEELLALPLGGVVMLLLMMSPHDDLP
ncbi:MAG: hypothetical protein OJF52_002128 [Nitrospira sp.]|jgi:hypothetical protein|nr:MAG: hypothetical protein OJF52_002128 [Nitrospira sp.]